MNREKAKILIKAYDAIGVDAFCLVEASLRHVELIRAYAEGADVQTNSISGCWTDVNEPWFYHNDEYRIVKKKKRYCNGVELEDCIKPGDELPDEVYIAAPDLANRFYTVFVLDYAHDIGRRMRSGIEAGIVYRQQLDAITHAEAMLNTCLVATNGG